MKSRFKRTINWNKYQSKVTTENRNQLLDHLINPSFHGVNRFFVLSFKDNAHRTRYVWYFLPKVEIKYYNVIIDGKSFFDQQVKKALRMYDNVRKL